MLTATIKGSIVDPLQASVAASVDGLTGEVVWTPLGARGIGIKTIEKTGAEGLVDTYTITYTDGHTSNYRVRNGEPGKNGATFTPHVDEEGNLRWSNDGGLENPPEVNVRGPEGPKNYAPRLWMLDAKKEAYEGELAPLSRFVGAQEATVETVFPGDLVLLTQDGTVCRISYVEESTAFHDYPIAGLGFRVATLKTGTDFSVDNHTLKLENGVMRVNTAPSVEQDNTLPITSAAVFAEVGNINALLETI